MTTKEEAKSAAPGVGFANAIPVLKAARRVARVAWDEGTYISVEDGVLTVARPMGSRPYQLSLEDVFAEDWKEVPLPKPVEDPAKRGSGEKRDGESAAHRG